MAELQQFFLQHRQMAERVAIALCARIERPADFAHWSEFSLRTKVDWQAFRRRGEPGRPEKVTVLEHRRPPLPGLKRVHGRFPDNHCPVCCQPTFEGGDWRNSAGAPRWNRNWHAPCIIAHDTWTRYADLAMRLALAQGGRCPITRERIVGTDRLYVLDGVQVDHIVPLWRIAADAQKYQWPDVLRFWGLGNLQALSREGHLVKNAREARARASLRRSGQMAGQPQFEI